MRRRILSVSALVVSFACGSSEGLESVEQAPKTEPPGKILLEAEAYDRPAVVGDGFSRTVVLDPPRDPAEPKRTLTNDDRRAFLRYYAPVVYKASSESATRMGRDWITNYDFDADQSFSNNKDNWERLQDYVTGGQYPSWSIRPTLYCAMIEFVQEGRRSAVLLYHVYHAKQEGSIHDWERIEIRVNGISGAPGSGEVVRYAVVTEHSKHNSREGGDPDLNFLETALGHHLMVWQAPETDTLFDFDKAELHYVEDSWASIQARRASGSSARVDVNGDGNQDFHYVFVPGFDEEAVRSWNARSITQNNAAQLSAGTTARVSINDVRAVQYELQDLADIFATHWVGGRATRHWTSPNVRVFLASELAPGLDGGPPVPVGLQVFRSGAIDDEDPDEDRRGYPRKHWFWGAYEIGSESFYGLAFNEGAPRAGRGVANRDPESLGAYFHQHDFFVHEGSRDSGGVDSERGFWLPAGWHTAEEDGFDGRWVQLFDNQAP